MQTHMDKVAICMFLAEFINYATRGEQDNRPLFDYIVRSLQWLDGREDRYANFHLVFMLRFSMFVGFFPNLDDYAEGDYFDLRRSEEHTSELQSRQYLVCRLLLEKKKNQEHTNIFRSCHS